MSTYTIRSVPPMDLCAALNCEAERAESERMTGTAKRQRELAVHIRNAVAHLTALCPEGYRVDLNLEVTLVPSVNPVAMDPTPAFAR